LLQSHAGGSVPLLLSAELTAQLRALSQRHGVTLFMTLLAAWSTLMARLSGQTDVVIGTPVANRQRREVEDLIGFFVNTLALRVRLDNNPTVTDLLQQVKELALSVFAHQELPFEQVVEAVKPERSLSHSPLFQVMMTLNNTPDGGEQSLSGLTLAPVPTTHKVASFDLLLSLNEGAREIAGDLEYASALFDHDTVQRFVDAFIALLNGIVDDESASVATLPLLTENERYQLLNEFNDTATAYPRDALIHELFEAQVKVNPDAIAVVYEDQSLSYSELNTRANQLAHYLISLGVQADNRVALGVERGLDLVVGVLGILKAGGAYVPLDPSYPAERLRFMLSDSAPKILLTQAKLANHWPSAELATVRLDIDLPVLAAQLPTHNPDAQGLSSQNFAYVIYTSGSTGQPKGVCVSHQGLTNYLHAAVDHYWRADLSGAVVSTPVSFDATLTSLMTPWLLGKPCILLQEDSQVCLEQLAQFIQKPDAYLFKLTPAHLQFLCHSSMVSPTTVGHVIVVGGEQLTRRLLAKVRQVLLPKALLVNEYGPTETVVGCTVHVCTEHDAIADGDNVTIGRPIANTQIYILDAHGEPVPVGVVGELFIAGDGVARGYLNRPDLTAERFLTDPFSTKPTARMYKTGDLGRWLADGTLEFLGRNDFQVKIRGFRIELGEIEARLASCAGVREAAVLAREDVPGDKRLVAYWVGIGDDINAADLRTQLGAQLPDYMVPSAFVQLSVFPLTPNGKLDRKALPAPDGSVLALREYEAPQGEVENTLARIWQDLLNVEQVGRHDNFFELGGHSLLAVQMVSLLENVYPHQFQVRDLFIYHTLSELATHLSEHVFETRKNWSPLVALSAKDNIPVIYAVPGVAMTSASFLPLARAIGNVAAIHAFEPRGLDKHQTPLLSMQEIVVANVEALLAHNQNGPYLIMGHSFGGAVAFEMALELQARRKIVRLVLLDSMLVLPNSANHLFKRKFETRIKNEMEKWQAEAAPIETRLQVLTEIQTAIYENHSPTGRFNGDVDILIAKHGYIASLSERQRVALYQPYVSKLPAIDVVDEDHLTIQSSTHVASWLTSKGVQRPVNE